MPQGPKGERRPRDVIGNAVHVMRIARVQSSRRLEREAGRSVEVMWLTGRALPDHQTLADFRKDNGRAIRQVCSLQPAALRALANDTDKIVALLKGTTGRDAGLIATNPKRRCLAVLEPPHSSGGPLRTDAYHSHP